MARKKKRKERDRKDAEPQAGDLTAAAPSVPATSPTKRITPLDIQQKEFRLSAPVFGRGYHEHDVDSFLDEITEEVARLHAENRRLREQAEYTGTAPMDPGAAAEADDVIRGARREAARIVAEAESRAVQIGSAAAAAVPPTGGAPGEAGTGALPGPSPRSGSGPRIPLTAFLAREREFLQSLAGLIQSHADSVKSDVRKARETIARQSPVGAGSPAAPASGAGPGSPAVSDRGANEGLAEDGTSQSSSIRSSPAATTDSAPEGDEPDAEPPQASRPSEPSRPEAEEPWQAPVSLQAPSPSSDRPGSGEGQGPAGDDEASPWRSSSGLIVTGAGATGGRPKLSTDRSIDRGARTPLVDPVGDPDRLLDLTGREPRLRTADPEDADAAYGPPLEEADLEEPSLRELFWGQE